MKAVRVALAIGIAILLPMLAQMTVRIFAEPPSYAADRYPPTPKTAEERVRANADQRRKDDLLERQEAEFNLKNFYVSFPLGVIELILGALLRKRPTLAAGVIFGGLSTVACGSYSSWETLPGWARYVSLLFALVLICVLAILSDRPSEAPRAPASA
jgi:hypothetical protein